MPEQVADRRLDLVAEGIDLATRLGRTHHQGLIACAAPAYLAQHGMPTTPAEFVRHNRILFDQPDYPHHWPVRAADAAVNGNDEPGSTLPAPPLQDIMK